MIRTTPGAAATPAQMREGSDKSDGDSAASPEVKSKLAKKVGGKVSVASYVKKTKHEEDPSEHR